ncbi:PREDICTED: apolipoprotein D-like [Branchiostoma belcheri]|uniref:Apolipoprotein D n=1 Tax=Branchiostoma belcheri TaxID=7741 RepID=A0A6P4YNB1_BRABE|nr:PREDICTED: apolipoprotein D-like [Branchiostoma belcheri]
MEKLVALVVFSCAVSVAQGQVFSWGKCPDVPVKSNFSVDAYLGRWFEIARFPTIFEKGLKCVQANYSLLDDSTIQVVNQGQKKCCGDETKAVGVAWAPDADEPAKLLVRFSRFMPAGPYWVLDTDYSRYSVVWSCVDLFWGVARLELTWILGRERALDEYLLRDIVYELTKFKIDAVKFKWTDQNNCAGSNSTVPTPIETVEVSNDSYWIHPKIF